MAGAWLVCLSLGALLFHVNGASLGPSCSAEGAYSSDIHPMENFDMEAFTGNWYMNQVKTGIPIASALFYVEEDPMQIRVSAKFMNQQTCFTRIFQRSATDVPGAFELASASTTADLWILWTDYHHAAIFAMCANGTITAGGTCERPMFAVLSRHIHCHIPQDALDAALDFACLDQEQLVAVDQSRPCQHEGDCDGPSYSYSLYPMTEFDITKYTGCWTLKGMQAGGGVVMEDMMQCLTLNEDGVSATGVTYMKYGRAGHPLSDCISQEVQITIGDTPGILKVVGEMRGRVVHSDMYVVYTDYHTTSIVILCRGGTISPGGTCEQSALLHMVRRVHGGSHDQGGHEHGAMHHLAPMLHMACIDMRTDPLTQVSQEDTCLPTDDCAEGTTYSKTIWPMHFTHESLRQFAGIWYMKSSSGAIKMFDGIMHFFVGAGEGDAQGKVIGRFQDQANDCAERSFGVRTTETPGLLNLFREDNESDMMILATDFYKYAIVTFCRGGRIEPGGTCDGVPIVMVMVRRPDYEVCPHSLGMALRMTCLSLDDLTDTPQDNTCAPVDDCGQNVTYKANLQPMEGLTPASFTTSKWWVKLINRLSPHYSLSDRWVQFYHPQDDSKRPTAESTGRVRGEACQEVTFEIEQMGIPGITSWKVVSPPGMEMTLSGRLLATDYENYLITTSCRNGYIAPGGYCQQAVFVVYVNNLEFNVPDIDDVIASALDMTCWTVEDLVVMDHSHPCPEDKDGEDPNEIVE